MVSGDEQSADAQNSIKEYYETNGGNVIIKEDVGFIVTYPNREMAEKVSTALESLHSTSVIIETD